MKKYRVVYLAAFECEVELPDGWDQDTLDDAVCDIDIPEGGKNGSVYCEGSFQTVEIPYEEDE